MCININLDLDALDELHRIIKASEALQLSIDGLRATHRTIDGCYGEALEMQACELTQRIEKFRDALEAGRVSPRAA
jgi:hypothetical protein